MGKLNMIKPKPTIRAIVYSEEKLKLIGKKLANPILSEYRKKEYIRRFVGEHCAICHEVPLSFKFNIFDKLKARSD